MHSRHAVRAPLHRLMFFAQWAKVRRMIEGVASDPKQTFWIMTMNLLLDAAAIEWSKVFGSRKEDTHWTKVVPQEQHESIFIELLKHLGMMQEEWKAFRDSIVEYRNKMVAHHDLKAAIPNLPRYDKALDAAYFMFEKLQAYANPNELDGIPNSLDRWSNTVANNMSAIVRTAFAASARLGSNVGT